MPASSFTGYGAGRQIAMSGTVTLDGSLVMASGGSVPYPSPAYIGLTRSQAEVGYNGLGQFITFETFTPWDHNPFVANPIPALAYGVTVTLPGETPVHLVVQQFTAGTNPASYSFTETLSWSLTLDVNFAFIYTLASVPAGSVTSGPDGLAMPEWQNADSLLVGYRARESDAPSGPGSYTFSVSGTGGSTSVTKNWGAVGALGGMPDVVYELDSAHAQVVATASASSLSLSCTATANWSYSTANLSTAASYTATDSAGTMTLNYGVSPNTCQAVASNVAGSSLAKIATARADVAPPKDLLWKGFVKGLTGPVLESGSPADPTITITHDNSTPSTHTATGGYFSRSIFQRWERIQGTTGQEFLATTRYDDISAEVTPDWMSTTRGYVNRSTPGTPSNYGAIFHHKDKRITALEVSLDPETALTGGTDSAVTGGVRRTWSGKQSLLSYRYLVVSIGAAITAVGKVRIVRTALSPATGLLTSYEWDTDWLGSPITGAGPFVIDLLHPSNATVELDATPTTWPDEVSPASGMRLGEGWLTGPSWVDALEVIGAVSGGGATTITGLTRRRAPSDQADRASRISCINQQGAWFSSEPTGGLGGTVNLWKRPFLSITSDGRVEAVSESDGDVLRVSGSTFSARGYTLTELGTALTHARNPGVSIAHQLPARATILNWYDRELPAVGLLGAGWLWDVASQQFVCTLDTSLSGGAMPVGPIGDDIPAIPGEADSAMLDYQLGARFLSVPGNVGDIFGHAGTATTTGQTLLAAVATIHAGAYGVVLGEGAAPAEVATLTVYTKLVGGITTVEARGTDDTDGIGYFATGDPYLRGYRLEHDIAGPQTGVVYASPRRRFPVRFLSGDIPGLEILNAETGWVALVTVESNQLRWKRWEMPVPLGATPVANALITSLFRDSQPSLAYTNDRRITLLFRRANGGSGAGVYEMVSDDDGDTWSTPAMSIPNGQQPRQAADFSGGLLRAAWVPDTASIGFLKATWQDPGDAAPSAVFTLKDKATSADLRVKRSGYDISASPDGASRINLTCTIEAETTTSNWYSEDGGRTWTRS